MEMLLSMSSGRDVVIEWLDFIPESVKICMYGSLWNRTIGYWRKKCWAFYIEIKKCYFLSLFLLFCVCIVLHPKTLALIHMKSLFKVVVFFFCRDVIILPGN